MCVFNKIILLVLGSWLFCVNAFTAQRPYDSHPEVRVYEAELKLFYEAIKFGHVELVRTFLQISSGEKVDIFTGSILPHLGTVLHMAALHCQTEIVKILLDVVSARGQNRVVYIMAGDLDGYTALHRVVLFGVQFNESKNAKVQDIHAYARQHTPNLKDQFELAKFLIDQIPLEKRAEFILAKNRAGHTALQLAEVYEQTEMVNLFKTMMIRQS